MPVQASYLQVQNGTPTQSSNLTEYIDGSTSYVLVSTLPSITNNVSGYYNISLDCGSQAAGTTGYCLIYKNGIVFGTERTKEGSYQTFSENFYGIINTTDIFTVWIKRSGFANGAMVRNVLLKFDYSSVSILSPANNSAQTSRIVNATWNGTSPFQYQISQAIDFSTLLYNTTTSNNFSGNLTLPTGLNYIRVRGYNATEDSVTNWSNPVNVKIMSNIYDINITGLVGWWHLDDNLLDSSGKNHNGTIVGTGVTYKPGQFNNASNFSGTGYITTGNITDYDFNLSEPYSIVAWINTSKITETQMVVANIDPSVVGYYFYFDNSTGKDELLFTQYCEGFTYAQVLYDHIGSPYPITDNKRHMLVGTNDGSYNGNGMSYYYDAMLLATGSGIPTGSCKSSSPLYLASMPYNNQSNWTEIIDEVQVYNRTLYLSDVQKLHYNYTVDNPYPELVSWGNSQTNNQNTSFNVSQNSNITFNVTTNQSVNLIGNDITISGMSFYYVFDTVGTKIITVFGQNPNGTTQSLTWNVTVLPLQTVSFIPPYTSAEPWNRNWTNVSIRGSINITSATITIYTREKYTQDPPGTIRRVVNELSWSPNATYSMTQLNTTDYFYNFTNLIADNYTFVVNATMTDGLTYSGTAYTKINETILSGGGEVRIIYLMYNSSLDQWISSQNRTLWNMTLYEPEYMIFPNNWTSGYQLYRCRVVATDTYYDDTTCGTNETSETLGYILGEYNKHTYPLNRYFNSVSGKYVTLMDRTSIPEGYSFEKTLGYAKNYLMHVEDMIYLNNSQVTVGVDKKFGGAILYMANNTNATGRTRYESNMINNFDCGRDVQNSYYDLWDNYAPSSVYEFENSSWNALQVGSRFCEPSPVTSYYTAPDNRSAWFKANFTNFNTINGNGIFSGIKGTTTYNFDGEYPVIIANYTVENTFEDNKSYAWDTPWNRGSEIPAVFLNGIYDNFYYFNSTDTVWVNITESGQEYASYNKTVVFGAALNDTGFGIGLWNWGRPLFGFSHGYNTSSSTFDDEAQYITASPRYALMAPGIEGSNYTNIARIFIGNWSDMVTYYAALDSEILFDASVPVNTTTENNSVNVIATSVNQLINVTLTVTNISGTYFIPMGVSGDKMSANVIIYNLTLDGYTNYSLSANFTIGTTDTSPFAWTMYVQVPPSSITNLQNVTTQTSINWTWVDPIDSDLSHVMIYLNGVWQANISAGTQYYPNSSLQPDTEYTISTHTVDTAGNVNQTWVNQTTRTNSDIIPSFTKVIFNWWD